MQQLVRLRFVFIAALSLLALSEGSHAKKKNACKARAQTFAEMLAEGSEETVKKAQSSRQVRQVRKREKLEKIVRYGNRAEAESTIEGSGLVLKFTKQGRAHRQNKWIAETGRIPQEGKNLGRAKNYTHRMDFDVEEGTLDWLKQFETKPLNEPGRYEIPWDKLDEFNRRIVNINTVQVR